MIIDTDSMSLKEIHAAIVQAESQCDGIKQASEFVRIHLKRSHAMRLREIGGCCGRQDFVDVESRGPDGQVIERTRAYYCGVIGDPCPIANMGCRMATTECLNDLLNEVSELINTG